MPNFIKSIRFDHHVNEQAMHYICMCVCVDNILCFIFSVPGSTWCLSIFGGHALQNVTKANKFINNTEARKKYSVMDNCNKYKSKIITSPWLRSSSRLTRFGPEEPLLPRRMTF